MKITHDESLSSYQFVRLLLASAETTGRLGSVGKYLVGATLQLRFPSMTIENKTNSAADQQRGKSGDFRIGDTVFHVTVAPGPLLYEKCLANINNELKAYLVVPEGKVVGVRQNAEFIPGARITVTSIEAFVSQNIDEISGFNPQEQQRQLVALLASYNQRVNAVEVDKSLLIEIPATLGRSKSHHKRA